MLVSKEVYYNIAEKMGLSTAEFYKVIGDLYNYFNEPEIALQYYNKAKNRGLESGEFYKIQGDILLRDTNNTEEALKNYNKAESLGLKTPEIYRKQGELLGFLNKQTKAKEYYDKALDLNPEDSVVLEKKLSLQETMESEKALEQEKKCLEAIEEYKEQRLLGKALDSLFAEIDSIYSEIPQKNNNVIDDSIEYWKL